MEDGFAGGWRELADDIAGGVGKRAAEAEDLLARGAGVENDGVRGNFRNGPPGERGGSGVTAESIWLSAQSRLTAVGRVARSVLNAA